MSNNNHDSDLLGGWEDDSQADSSVDDMFGMDEDSVIESINNVADPRKNATINVPGNSNSDIEFQASHTKEKAKPQSDGYVVIARKYRPQTFNQLVGQDNVQGALSGAIASGQISHAYLFSGPRGTGKTSTARILAKSVNCQNGGPRPDPCGQCASCRSITVGSSLDVIEIDAASNTGVDNIRELKSGVALAPFSRFKVYIVDEVHMLSNQAFNALLKTLEEPPPQVIFVLATTELHKVPETIISRCQSFAFRRFSLVELKSQLGKILDIETAQRNIIVEPAEREQILDLIARSAEGGMRDAQVTLDQALVLSRDKLDFETVRRFLGMVDNERMDLFVQLISDKDSEGLFNTIDDLVVNGQDLELFVKTVCEYVRDLLIIKSTKSRSHLVSVSDDRYEQLKGIVNCFHTEFLHSTASMLLRLTEEMKLSNQPRYVLELALLKLTLVDSTNEIENLRSKIEKFESQLVSGQFSVIADNEKKNFEITRPDSNLNTIAVGPEISSNDPIANPPELAPAAEVLSSTVANFSGDQILKALQKKTDEVNHILHITLIDFASVGGYDGFVLQLDIDESDKFGIAQLNRPQSLESLVILARQITGTDIKITWKTVSGKRPSSLSQNNPQDYKPEDKSKNTITSPVNSAPVARESRPLSTENQGFSDEENGEYEVNEIGDFEPTFYYTDDARQKMMQTVSSEAWEKILNSRTDLMQIVEKAKQVFKLDEKSFRFRICNIN